MASSVLVESRSGSTAWLRINRPEKRNAISGEIMESTIAALARLRDDAEVRCVVLTDEGDVSFSVGLDFKYLLRKRETGEGPDFLDMLKAIYEFPKVVIASVNGYCLRPGSLTRTACKRYATVPMRAATSKRHVRFFPFG